MAFVLMSFCGNLWGEEVLLISLLGMKTCWEESINAPEPFIIIMLTLHGRFKGDNQLHWHCIPIPIHARTSLPIMKWIRWVLRRNILGAVFALVKKCEQAHVRHFLRRVDFSCNFSHISFFIHTFPWLTCHIDSKKHVRSHTNMWADVHAHTRLCCGTDAEWPTESRHSKNWCQGTKFILNSY